MKQNLPTWGLAVLLALVAGVVAYVLWADPGPETRTAGSGTGVGWGGSAPAEDLRAPSAPAESARAASTSEPAAITADAHHVLVGRVVDDAARPVAGADVYLAAEDRSNGTPVERLDPDALPWARRSTTKTDEAGLFRLARNPASSERLGIRAQGFVPHDAAIAASEVPLLDVGDVVLRTGIVLAGRVLDAARVPVVGARVHRIAADARPSTVLGLADADAGAITDASGGFVLSDLEPGAWTLLVKADGHPDELERGTAEAGRAVSGVEIVLEDGAEIRGRVVHAPAEALATLWIRAVPVTGAPVGGLYAGDRVDPERFVVLPRGAHCAADGSFVVRGLTVGLDYRVSARVGEHDYFGPVRTGQVVARAGARDVELVYRAGTVLEFQVVDGATSDPITDFEVRVGRGRLEPIAKEGGGARHEFAGGRVRIVHGLDGGDEPLQLEIEARGYEVLRLPDVRATAGQKNDLGLVRLVASPRVTVRVVDDAAGTPVVGARVALVAADVARDSASGEPSYARHADVTDGDGRVRLSALAGGSVRLTVVHPEFAPFRSEIAGAFGVARDEVVRLRAGGTVVVEVRDANGLVVRGMRIRHASAVQDVAVDDARDPDRSRTDAEGRLVFEHLSAGEHAFELEVRRTTSPSSVADSAPRRVVVADGRTETITWTVPARGRTSGRVTANALGVAGATVQFTPRDAAASDSAESLVARTNGNGEYVFGSIELGTYAVSVVHPSRRMPFETEVAVDTLQHSFDIALPPTALRGRVVDGEGRPLADVIVHVGRAAEQSVVVDHAFPPDSSVRTDADGAYVLDGVQGDVDLVVQARHPEFQPSRSEITRVAEGETRANVDFALAPGAVLAVAVVRAGPSCRVRLVFAEDQGAKTPDVLAPLGANGTARITGLRPGRWRVRLEDCSDPARGSDEVAEQVVEVAHRRANSVRFELP